MRRALRLGLLMVALASPARAVQPDEMLADPVLEARARALSAELRCMVCQNQSIDDSDAPLARDLRILVRERLAAGDSDADLTAFLVERYGDYILLRPPFEMRTVLLWSAPFAVALGGLAALLLAARRTRAANGPVPLSEREKQAIEDILGRPG